MNAIYNNSFLRIAFLNEKINYCITRQRGGTDHVRDVLKNTDEPRALEYCST